MQTEHLTNNVNTHSSKYLSLVVVVVVVVLSLFIRAMKFYR